MGKTAIRMLGRLSGDAGITINGGVNDEDKEDSRDRVFARSGR